MRVFVVGTGRCGSCTFYQACRHATNYTAGHESNAGVLGRFKYQDQHIEVCPQLSGEIGSYARAYPGAKWVHLIRDREATVTSLVRNCPDMLAKWAFIYRQVDLNPADLRRAAGAFYDSRNDNVEAILRGLPFHQRMTLRLDAVKYKWADFWRWIRAEGDFDKSLATWDRKYNPTGNRGRDEFDRG